MNFAFFDTLTSAEAQKYLDAFLDTEAKAVSQMVCSARTESVIADFSLESILPTELWLLGKIKTFPKSPDETVPLWIRETEIYTQGLFELDEKSKFLVLRGAFYWGESMIRSNPRLKWATGNIETAEKNMPVVTGLKHSEFAPILVVDNLFRRVIQEPNRVGDIDRAIKAWILRMP